MNSPTQAAPAQGEATPSLAPPEYTAVVVFQTGTIEGHEYKRGTKHLVDAVVHAAMVAEGMIPAPDAQPAA